MALCWWNTVMWFQKQLPKSTKVPKWMQNINSEHLWGSINIWFDPENQEWSPSVVTSSFSDKKVVVKRVSWRKSYHIKCSTWALLLKLLLPGRVYTKKLTFDFKKTLKTETSKHNRIMFIFYPRQPHLCFDKMSHLNPLQLMVSSNFWLDLVT